MMWRGPLVLVVSLVMAACVSSESSESPSGSATSTPPAVASEDWMQRGYDGHSSYNPAERDLSPANIHGVRRAWQERIRPRHAVWIWDGGVQVGAVVGHRVFVSWSSDEAGGSHLAVLDTRDGRTIWERSTEVAYRSFVGVAGPTAIVAGGGVRGLDAATGGPRWSQPSVSELAIDPASQTVFVATRNHVTALSTVDGSHRWDVDLSPRDVVSGFFIDGTPRGGDRGRSSARPARGRARRHHRRTALGRRVGLPGRSRGGGSDLHLVCDDGWDRNGGLGAVGPRWIDPVVAHARSVRNRR